MDKSIAIRVPKFLPATIVLPAFLATSLHIGAVEITPSDCLNISVDTEGAPQLNAAVSICTRVLGRSDLSPTVRTELLVHRGIAYRNLGDLNQSEVDLAAAKTLSPVNSLVSRMLAWTYREMGRLADAEVEYGRALKLEPNAQAFLSRCFVRHDLKKVEEALADCESAHSVEPSEDSTFMTALLYSVQGRASSALVLLEGAIGTPIESGRLYGLLAEVYEQSGRARDASRIRQQGRRKFPRDEHLTLPPAR